MGVVVGVGSGLVFKFSGVVRCLMEREVSGVIGLRL